MLKQKSNLLSTTSKNEEGLNNFCAIREREDREERLRKLLTLYNNEEFKKDKQNEQKYVYLLNQLPKVIKEVIKDTLNGILSNSKEHNIGKKSLPDTKSTMIKRIKFLKELDEQIGFELLEMDSSKLKNFVELSQKPSTARIFNTKDLQLKSGEKMPEIPGLQIEDLWDPADPDFPSSPILGLQVYDECRQSSIASLKDTQQNGDSFTLGNIYIHSEILSPRIIPGLQEYDECRQSSIASLKETQQSGDSVPFANSNNRAEILNFFCIEAFRAIKKIYEGNHRVAKINEFNANVKEIFLIIKEHTKELTEQKNPEKHSHLKKLKKITETLKIFIDESPLSYLISEKNLILKKDAFEQNSTDKEKIDLKIKYSIHLIMSQSKKFEKRLLEAAKFLDNQNIQSKKPSTFAERFSESKIANQIVR